MVRTPKNQTRNRSMIESLIEETTWNDIASRFEPLPIDEPPDIIGCKEQCDTMEEYIKVLISGSKDRSIFLLLTGPPESGKTTILRKMLHQYKDKLSIFHLNCSWIQEKTFGDPNVAFNLLCDQAKSQQPSIIYIEDIELANVNLVNKLLNRLIRCPSRVMVVADTDAPESLNPKLLRASKFSRKINISMPTPDDRFHYIERYLSAEVHSIDKTSIQDIVTLTHCYSYGDLDRICSEASYKSLNAKLSIDSFKEALKDYKPYLIECITKPLPPLKWNQIGGVEYAKTELQRCVIEPLTYHDIFTEMGVSKVKGALLYGPPGCSKTMLARALAAESGYQFIYIEGPELNSKYVGESEAEVRKIYRNARAIAPCIVFIDEIDGLAPIRGDEQNSVGSRIVTTLLLELDGARTSGDVFTIGATNRPHSLDKALLRSGRLELHIYIPLPSEEDRQSIFKVHIGPMLIQFEIPHDVAIKKLASLTHNYSGAEIAALCNCAGSLAISEYKRKQAVQWTHFEAALKIIRPKTDLKELRSYERFKGGDLHNSSMPKKLLTKLRKLKLK